MTQTSLAGRVIKTVFRSHRSVGLGPPLGRLYCPQKNENKMYRANKTLINILFGLVVAAVVGIMTGAARADVVDQFGATQASRVALPWSG